MVTLDYEMAAHLYRRAGFGGSEAQINALVGMDAGDAADRFLTFKQAKSAISGNDLARVARSWLKRMIQKPPLQEKLVLFWHGHFATSIEKVDDFGLMATQNKLFRTFAGGNFKALVRAVTKDPAMLVFLDGQENVAGNPNENYARELMELFTLGILDDAGVPNYSQDDVHQLARALTGYYIQGKKGLLDPDLHDSDADKAFMGVTGNLGVEGVTPADDVIEIIFSHPDTRAPQKPRVARFMARKAARFFGPANPSDALVDAMADAFVASGFEVLPMLRALFTDPEFYDPANMTSTVKSPVEFILQPIKMLKGKSTFRYVPDSLEPMGQVLYAPPNVAGWPGQLAWITAGTLLERYSYARDFAAGRSSILKFDPTQLLVGASTTTDIVNRALYLLGPLQPPAGVVSRLDDYLNDPTPPGDITDETFVDEKVRGLVALVIQLPHFQVH
jgi:uncharacterized protein (DUF1800 family)